MIFGTDGIRARMGVFPVDRETIEKLSHVLDEWLGLNVKVVIGNDTRASCNEIKGWVTKHLNRVTVCDLGVAPTPVVAYETRARKAKLGIMITASHNPAKDNGLKFFDRQGLKIPYDLAKSWSHKVIAEHPRETDGAAIPIPVTATHYRDFVLRHFDKTDFRGLRIGFDLANGAASGYIKELVADLELNVCFIGDTPNGHNINEGVGALQAGGLANLVREKRLHAGFALDGDADRLAVVLEQPLHGDVTLYALFKTYQLEGRAPNTLVGTIMCGMGLQQTLFEQGVTLVRTPVGDQNVLHEMVCRGLPLGGETSGHLIQADLFPAGDGFLAALRLARSLTQNPTLLEEARAAVPLFPVIEKAYRVRHKPPLESIEDLHAQIELLRGQLGNSGRMILRYSGTEALLRFYLEAPDLTPYRRAIGDLEAVIMRELL